MPSIQHPCALEDTMKRESSLWPLIGLTMLGGMFVALGWSNPVLLDYQAQVLGPAVQDRRSASDAMLTSILQSIPLPKTSSENGREAPNVLMLLTDRTKRANYVVFSVYSTEFDYCDSATPSRAVGRSLGIAGTFYTLEKGACPASHSS
jgi:Domain of unknown function (DUF4359)